MNQIVKPEPQRVRRSDYRPPDFELDQVELRFDLALPVTRVTANFLFARCGVARNPLVLDGERLSLVELRLDGRPLPAARYTITDHDLTVHDPPDRGELTIITEITPGDTGMEGLIHLGGRFVTHCEPGGFRRITYFPVRPDVLARYRCTLVADPELYPTLLSNGDLIESGPLSDGRHFATWQDPFPKASYLFALVAGRFGRMADRFVTRSGRVVELAVYADTADLPFCEHGLAALKRAMRWDEEAYGLEYDLDVLNLAVMRSYPGGAMENKGLNLYTAEVFLASPEVARDQALRRIEATVGHEYFHNWSGNRVGCRDWFQLSLKEGFTIFRQQQFMASIEGEGISRIEDVSELREGQFPEDEGGLAHAVRPDSYLVMNNLYTGTIYGKGAEVIRMMQSIVGDRPFNTAARAFFRAFDGKATTIDALVDTVEKETRTDLSQFRRWYAAIGAVRVRAEGTFEPATHRYVLSLEQCAGNPAGVPEPLCVPVRLRLLDPCGQPLPLRLAGEPKTDSIERVLLLRSWRAQFVFEDVMVSPVPSLFRGFSAPVRLDVVLADEALALLASHDTDPFNRWEAAQRLASRAVLDGLPGPWYHVFAEILARVAIDPAIAGRMLQLPSERLLGQHQSEVDVDGLHLARLGLAVDTARRFRERLRDRWNRLRAGEDTVGARRLRNLCLWYLMQDPEDDDLARCWSQFRETRSMEDAVVALRLLIDRGGPDRVRALAEAYYRWREVPALLDQWFVAQAASDARDCADRVEALTHHPDYGLDNATRLKGMFDVFTANQSAFHERSGTGYRIVGELVLSLNGSNPRLAARFLKRFDGWRRFDEVRRHQITTILRRVADSTGLAPDLHEVVTLTLAGC